jgi:protein-L-isoaspartate O-methyltransferase
LRLAWVPATAALAREVVGPERLVVAVDIDATTLAFARENLERAGYSDVVLVHGDGGLGYPGHAPTTGSASRRPAPRSRRR